MVVYSIYYSTCFEDCEQGERDVIKIKAYNWKEKKKLDLGKVEIPYEDVAYYSYYEILKPGERKIFAILKGGDNNLIYLDYPDEERRVYLDYDKYIYIYNMLKTLNMKKVKVNGVEFTFNEEQNEARGDNGIRFGKNYFTIILSQEKDTKTLFTKSGAASIEFEDNMTILKGECISVPFKDDLVLCYGDPS